PSPKGGKQVEVRKESGAVARPPSPGEPTGPYQREDEPVARFKVALVADLDRPHLTSDTQALLRKRLLIIYALCTAAIGFIAAHFFVARFLLPRERLLARVHDRMPPPFFLLHLLRPSDGTTGILWLDYALDLSQLAVLAALVAILWSKRQLSL